MAAEEVTCTSCDWAGDRLETDDTHGVPECPECGGRVLVP